MLNLLLFNLVFDGQFIIIKVKVINLIVVFKFISFILGVLNKVEVDLFDFYGFVKLTLWGYFIS